MTVATYGEGRICLPAGPESFAARELLKRDLDGRWNKDRHRWEFPATRDHVETMRRRLPWLRLETAVAQWQPEGVPILTGSKPYPHQTEGANLLLRSPRMLCVDEMGTGKTAQAIYAMTSWWTATPAEGDALVVCPNTLKEKWAEEIERHAAQRTWAIPLFGRLLDRAAELRLAGSGRIFILNYEAVDRLSGAIASRSWDFLVCDEAHRLKDARSKVSRAIRGIDARYTWLMTGTPIHNRPEDAWSLVDIVCPGLLGWYFGRFADQYLQLDRFGGVKGYRNLEEFRRRFGLVSFGRKLAECADLPEIVYESRVIELSEEERTLYRRVRDEAVAWLATQNGRVTVDVRANFAVRMTRLRQLSSGLMSEAAEGAHAFVGATSKLRECVDVWLDAGSPAAVVWYRWLPVGRRLEEVLGKRGAWVARIDGSVGVPERHRLVKLWGQQPQGVLLCQMDTAGEGIDLQHAWLQIFVDLPTTPGRRQQCVARLRRHGQVNRCVVVDLIAKDTVDGPILKMLERKAKWAETITEDSYLDSKREMEEFLA